MQVVAISNTTTVQYGSSTVLICGGFSGPAMVSLSWQYSGQTLTNDSNIIITSEGLEIEGVEGTFQLSYLQICNVRESSNYTCSVSNGIDTESAVVEVIVPGEYGACAYT